MPTDFTTLVKSSLDDVFNKGDATAAAKYFSPDLQQSIASGLKENRAAFPDLSYTVNQIAAAGDVVAFSYTAKGTHKGVFEKIQPTGKTAQWSGSAIATVTDGKITHIYLQEDWIAKLAALGGLAAAISVTGHWSGSAQGVTVTLNLTQSGDNVTGTLTMTGSSGTFPVTGSNKYPNVSLQSNLGNNVIGTFTGSFSGANEIPGHLTILGSTIAVTITRQ